MLKIKIKKNNFMSSPQLDINIDIEKNNNISDNNISDNNISNNNISNNISNNIINNDININDNLMGNSSEININEVIDNDDNLVSNKKAKKFFKMNKGKNELNNMELNGYKKHSNNLKEILNINPDSGKRSKTPIFKKKIDIINRNKSHLKITNLGGVKIKNNNE